MTRKIVASGFLAGVLLCFGCATCGVRFGEEETAVYPAVYADWCLIDAAFDWQAEGLLFVFGIPLLCDFAVSAVTDTALLPYDWWRWVSK